MVKKIFFALLFGVFIVISPKLDQLISVLPYNSFSHKFYGEGSIWCHIIYRAVPFLTLLLLITPIALLIKNYRNQAKFGSSKKYAFIIILSLWIGPGIIVNNVLKDHWGRPRPYQVLRDHKEFSPFWRPHFTAINANSFPSGHASVGFFLGVPLIALRRKKLGIAVSLFGGGLVGVVRILQGGHYLSDVVFAGLIVYLVTYLILKLSSFIFKDRSI